MRQRGAGVSDAITAGRDHVSIGLNYWLGAFNLIPLPPLDGSKILQSFLSIEATRKYEMISQYSFFILMALFLTGALSILNGPIVFLAQNTLRLMAWIFGIS